MKIKFENAKILTEASADIFCGDLIVNDDKIAYVGKPTSEKCDRVIDCKNNLIMPGFVNCHAHSPMILFRGLVENKNLQDWLFEINKLEKNLTPDDIYYGSLLAITEYLKSGITTVNDNYFMFDIISQAFFDSGMRLCVGLNLDYKIDKKITKAKLEQIYNELKTKFNSLISYNFYVHSLYGSTENDFSVCNNLAKKYNTFVSTHMSETLEEVGFVAKNNLDKSPTKLLEDYGFFDCNSLVAHSVYAFDNDIEILKKYNSNVAINISSNLKLGSGIPPVYSLIKKGINICLGTDSASSNNKLDMFREMYLTSVVQKGYLKKPEIINSEDVIKFATENGAKALKINDIGKLKENYKADIIMLNIENNSFDDKIIKNNIVFSLGTDNVMLTMVNGKVLYDRGEYFINTDIEKLKQKCKILSQKFLNCK